MSGAAPENQAAENKNLPKPKKNWRDPEHGIHLVLLILGVLLIDVLFQLSLSSNKTSSQAQIGQLEAAYLTQQELERTLSAYQASSYLKLDIAGDVYTINYADLGLSINKSRYDNLASYSTKQKLIPFSAFYRNWQQSRLDLELDFDSQKARQQLQELSAYSVTEPQPAELKLWQDELVAVEGKPGEALDIETTIANLGELSMDQDQKLFAATSKTYHPISSDQIASLAEIANQHLANPPKMIHQDKTIQVNRQELASWFYVQLEDDQAKLSLNQDLISAYLKQIASQFYIPAEGSKVTLLDDKEVTRVNGRSGQVLDIEKAKQDLSQLLTAQVQPQSKVDLRLIDVRSSVSYQRTYSKTNQGLSVYLKDVIAAKGNNYTISIIGIDKPGLRAEYNSYKQINAASTYKLFVAHYVFKQVQDGSTSYDKQLPSGNTTLSCLDQMLTVSSNPCAHELMNVYGPDNINNLARSSGFGSSKVGPATTTSRDLSVFIQKLVTGQLLQGEPMQRMLDMMHRQQFQVAIHAGLPNYKIANKTGSLGGFKYDAALLYAQQGRYVMAIMGYNASNAGVADIAKKADQFINGMPL